MLAIEFVRDAAKTPWPELVLDVTKRALASGVIVIRAGLYSNCLRFLPPLNITDEQLDEALAVVAEALAAAELALAPGTAAGISSAAGLSSAAGMEPTSQPSAELLGAPSSEPATQPDATKETLIHA